MDEQRADLFKVVLTEESRLTGASLRELQMPKNTDISLVIREDSAFVPGGGTVLRRGDELLVIAPAEDEDAVQDFFRRVTSEESEG